MVFGLRAPTRQEVTKGVQAFVAHTVDAGFKGAGFVATAAGAAVMYSKMNGLEAGTQLVQWGSDKFCELLGTAEEWTDESNPYAVAVGELALTVFAGYILCKLGGMAARAINPIAAPKQKIS